jgi:hypothetical protein
LRHGDPQRYCDQQANKHCSQESRCDALDGWRLGSGQFLCSKK